MNEYAKNFDRKGLDSDKGLIYYAKIEHHRQYKGTDKEVKQGQAKQGERKPGNNLHVHVIISRKSKDGKLKLSPLTNHRGTKKGAVKGGFDRVEFVGKCEKAFDFQFQHDRNKEESFKHLYSMKNTPFIDKLKIIYQNIKNSLEEKHKRPAKKLSQEKVKSLIFSQSLEKEIKKERNRGMGR